MDIKKIIAKLPTGYVDEACGMDGDQLRAEIVRAETALHEVDKAMKADEKLQGAKELLKDMTGAYGDARKAQRAKIAYSLYLLEERGELGTGGLDEDDAVTGEQHARKSGVPAAKPAARKTRAA